MEPFYVLNMGNILYFHLEYSNCYLSYLFKFRHPFKSPKKNLPIIGFMVLTTTGLNPNTKLGFEMHKS